MSTRRDRLALCFRLVLPGLAEEEILRASTESVPAWDSLAHVNLLAVLEEEFGIEIANADLPKLISFERILDFLDSRETDSART